jgi:hypothetical protein
MLDECANRASEIACSNSLFTISRASPFGKRVASAARGDEGRCLEAAARTAMTEPATRIDPLTMSWSVEAAHENAQRHRQLS